MKYGWPPASSACTLNLVVSEAGAKASSAALGNTQMSDASRLYDDAKSILLNSETVPSTFARLAYRGNIFL